MSDPEDAGILWIPEESMPSEGMTEEQVEDFTQKLIDLMTEPVGPRPEGAYICCFQVHSEPFEDD